MARKLEESIGGGSQIIEESNVAASAAAAKYGEMAKMSRRRIENGALSAISGREVK
jgi:hypothetical protein